MARVSIIAENGQHYAAGRSDRGIMIAGVIIIVAGLAITATVASLDISSGGSWDILLWVGGAAVAAGALSLGFLLTADSQPGYVEHLKPRQTAAAVQTHRSDSALSRSSVPESHPAGLCKTRVARRRRSPAWIYYAVITVLTLFAATSVGPQTLFVTALTAAYSVYLFRGGRFVIWIW